MGWESRGKMRWNLYPGEGAQGWQSKQLTHTLPFAHPCFQLCPRKIPNPNPGVVGKHPQTFQLALVLQSFIFLFSQESEQALQSNMSVIKVIKCP